MIRQIIGVAWGRAASAGLNLLVSLLLLAMLTKDDYGTYYFHYTIIVTVALLPNLAVNNGFVFQFQHSEHRWTLLYGYFLLKFSVLAIVGAMTVVLWSTGAVSGLLVLAIASGMMLSFFDTTLNVSLAEQKFAWYSALQPLRNTAILAAIGVAYVVVSPMHLDAVLWAFFAASLALAAFGIVQLTAKARAAPTRAGPTRAAMVELLVGSRRFFVFEMSALILTRVEVWVLQYYVVDGLLNSSDVAEYGAGFTLAFVFPILSSSIVSVLITKIVPGNSMESAGLRKLMMACVLAFIFSIIYAFLSYQASTFVLSDEYNQLHWIIPSLVFGMWMSLCTNIARVSLLAHELDKYTDAIYATQTVGGVILSFVLIGWMGLPGAVLGFVLIRLFVLIFIGGRFVMVSFVRH